MPREENRESSFDDFLKEEGTYDEVQAGVLKNIIVMRLEEARK